MLGQLAGGAMPDATRGRRNGPRLSPGRSLERAFVGLHRSSPHAAVETKGAANAGALLFGLAQACADFCRSATRFAGSIRSPGS